MKYLRFCLFCLVFLFMGIDAMCQNYTYEIEKLSNEGVRLNGIPIHPTGERIICLETDTVEVAKGSECKIRRFPEGVAWIGYCCTEKGSIKNGRITVGEAFIGPLQRHMRRKKHHNNDLSPKQGAIVYKDDDYAKYLYVNLGQTSQINCLDKLEKNYEFKSDTLVSFEFKSNDDSTGYFLLAKNNTISEMYAVAYLNDGDEVWRQDLVEIPKNKWEIVAEIEKKQGQFIYVFYCNKKNLYWGCLSDESTIYCRKISVGKE